MTTNTYYIAEFNREGDPRPKFIGSDSQLGLFGRCRTWGITPDTKNLYIVTVRGAVSENLLSSIDGCSIANNWDGTLCLCGEPIIHMSPMVANA